MASVVFNGYKKITFTATPNGTGTIPWSLTVQNGSSSATYVSTGPIELWIGGQRITTAYSGNYSGCADSSYNSWYHSVNFATGNASGTNARRFPAANGTITGTLDVGAGTHQMKMYVDYCYSNQKWTGTANVTVTVEDSSKDIFIGVNSAKYMEVMSKNIRTFPTWSAANGQDDLIWLNVGAGSWNRGNITYPYANGHYQDAGGLDDIWYTHVYNGNNYLGQHSYYPRIYVKYNANGGSSTPATQTKYIGSELTLAGAISRSHYTFGGWAAGSATGTKYNASGKLSFESWNSISRDYAANSGWADLTPTHSGNTITLYAVWSGNSYKVSYNANGGSSTPSAQTTTYPNSITLPAAIARNNATSTSNVTITISYNTNGGSTAPSASTGNAVNTKTTKYTFSKWNTKSDGTGTGYAAKASYQPTGNITLYATWTSSASTARTSNPKITLTSTKPTKANSTVSSYKVSYNANGGSSTPAQQTATKTRKYTFSKWNSKSDGTGTDYNSATAYTFSANVTLYAKYTTADSGGSVTLASAISRGNGSTAGYKVTYNANGGSGAPAQQTSGNRTITYKFNKWAAGSASGTQYAAGASYTPTAATTMYATWTSTTSVNSSWTCSSTKPTRSGYIFLGWSTSNTATTATYTAGTTYTITKALTLYAVWQEDQAKISVKVNGAWKKGKTYIKINGEWKKAKKVYVKVNGAWKENK